MEEKKYDVFISYSRRDYVDENNNVIPGNIVSRVKEALDNINVKYWFDESGVYSGDEFAPFIARAINNSEVFLFISSHNSNASDWTSNEIATAHAYKKKIIPFRIDNSVFNESVILYIAKLDYIDFTRNQDKAMTRLTDSITVHLNQVKTIKKRREEEKRQEEERLKKAAQKEFELKHLQTQLEVLSNEIADLRNQLQIKSSRYNELKFKEAELIGTAYQYIPFSSESSSQIIDNQDVAPSKPQKQSLIQRMIHWTQYDSSGEKRHILVRIVLSLLLFIVAFYLFMLLIFFIPI